MKRFLILTFICLVISGFVAFLPKTANASGGAPNTLFGVVTVGRDDAWATGESRTGNSIQTFIEHLEDNAWQVVPSPNPSGAALAELFAVTAISEQDVWAVGNFTPQGGLEQTLIEHWDGAQWQIVPSPNLHGGAHFLTGVAAISKYDVWAVGVNVVSTNTDTTLIEHWNGQTWQVVPSPNGGPFDFLEAVTAASENDVWAVGDFTDSNGFGHGLIEHWDGKVWNIIQGADPVGSVLLGVGAISQKDVWAVGYFFDSSKNLEALTEHWNGQAWQVIATPNPLNNLLISVAGVSQKDVWLVGGASQGTSTTLIEHWNGQVWQIISSPNPAGSNTNELFGVAARSHKDVWAVGGSFTQHNTHEALIEHWNGQSWTIVPSPIP